MLRYRTSLTREITLGVAFAPQLKPAGPQVPSASRQPGEVEEQHRLTSKLRQASSRSPGKNERSSGSRETVHNETRTHLGLG